MEELEELEENLHKRFEELENEFYLRGLNKLKVVINFYAFNINLLSTLYNRLINSVIKENLNMV